MIFLLSFLLSWCSGFLVVLLVAFAYYDSFSLVDITSFAVFTVAGAAIAVPLFYFTTLKFLGKKIAGRKQFLWFPLVLVLLSNLPVYYMIQIRINEFYGRGEALLFLQHYIVSAIVFGMSWAWKNNPRLIR